MCQVTVQRARAPYTTGSTAPFDNAGRLLLTNSGDEKKLSKGVDATKKRQKEGLLPTGEILEAGFRAYRLAGGKKGGGGGTRQSNSSSRI